MKYRVLLTPTAQADADAAYEWLAKRTDRAVDWFNGLADSIESLSQLPARCKLAMESAEFDEPVRQRLYGKSPNVYRILFIIRSDVVHVLHVRHAARRTLLPGYVVFPPDEV